MHAKTLVLLLALAPAALAKPILLGEKLAPDDCFRVQVRMSLEGDISFSRDGKNQTMPLKATAQHAFPERVLQVGKSGNAEKLARFYETAQATITAGKHISQRSLRPDRKLFVAQWQHDQQLVYSLTGPLLRDELDLCSEHFDTLHLPGLLPGGERSVGDTWKIPTAVVQAFCHFEGVTEQKLEGKLEEVKDGQALFTVKGPATGIELGSLVKAAIDARGIFDLASRRLVKLEWKQKDDRDQGPASPASVVSSTTVLERSVIQLPESLGLVALAGAPEGLNVPPLMLQMEYEHPKKVYDLMYPRNWHVVSQTEEHLVMRLLERGDFVAQVTVAVWEKALAGKRMSPEKFAAEMDRQDGWTASKTIDARELPLEKGRSIYRLSQAGSLNGLEVVQNFYLVAHEDGRQVVFIFSMTPKQADRLGTRDLSLAGSLEFLKQK